MNTFVIEGNLTRDPELRFTPSGTPVMDFSVAENRTVKGEDGDTTEAHFFDFTAWRGLAENMAASLKVGTRVLVHAFAKQDTWETDSGEKRSRVRFTAIAVGPSLRWATAEVTKNPKPGESDAPPAEDFGEEPF